MSGLFYLFERFGKPICGAVFLPYNVLRLCRQNPLFIPHTAKATAVFLFLSLLRGMKNAVPAKRNQAKFLCRFIGVFEKLQRKFRAAKYPKSLFGLPGIFYLFLRRLSSF